MCTHPPKIKTNHTRRECDDGERCWADGVCNFNNYKIPNNAKLKAHHQKIIR